MYKDIKKKVKLQTKWSFQWILLLDRKSDTGIGYMHCIAAVCTVFFYSEDSEVCPGLPSPSYKRGGWEEVVSQADIGDGQQLLTSETLGDLSSSFSNRLLHPHCKKEVIHSNSTQTFLTQAYDNLTVFLSLSPRNHHMQHQSYF